MIKKGIFFSILFGFATLVACTEEEPCIGVNWYYDEDGDGVGRLDSVVFQCEQPEFFVRNGTLEIDTPEEPAVPTSPLVPFVFEYGVQKAFYHRQTTSPYGFFLYVPPEYDSTTTLQFPLLIYLHGLGERGRSDISQSDLIRARWNGPPMLIHKGEWNVTNPMIVATPQTSGVWSASQLHRFIEFLMEKLNVDESRIYMTGLSMGANGCFNYVSGKGEEAYTAAIVPIAGWGDTTTGSQYEDVAVWAFHGADDNVIDVQSSINMVEAINNAIPQTTAKLTIYPGVMHPSWAQTFDGTGMGTESPDYDPFDINIYDWMFQFRRE